MKRLAATVFVVLLCAAGPIYALDITITSDSLIADGEQYDHVYVHEVPPQRTTLTIMGGQISELLQYEASTVNVNDGYVANLLATESSTVNVRGGTLPLPVARDQATLNIYAGEVGFFQVHGEDLSLINIYGGHIAGYLSIAESGTMNLFGGTLDQPLLAKHSSIVNVFGQDLQYDPSVSDDNPFPTISGRWLDGSPLVLRLYDLQTYDHINLLPEPSSIALLGLAVVLLGWLTRR